MEEYLLFYDDPDANNINEIADKFTQSFQSGEILFMFDEEDQIDLNYFLKKNSNNSES